MKQAFNHFKNQIPEEIYNSTKKHHSSDIIVFRPVAYLIDNDMYLQDYNFTILTSNPPPMKIDQREYQFGVKKMLVFKPDTHIRCTKEVPTVPYISLNIKKEFFNKIKREALGKKDVSFSNLDYPYSTKLVNLICSFEEESKRLGDSCDLMMKCIGTQIVVQILREAGKDYVTDEKRRPVHKNYVNLAKEYMATYYNANIKIEDICKHIHLSPYYFIRMFKEQTGQSPHDYLQLVRLKKAEEMLKDGNYSIEEVAKLNGFVSPSHFSSFFKSMKGITPSRFKKSYFTLK